MHSLLASSPKYLTINQAIKEIRNVYQSCNILNIAELVEKKILDTRFICNEYIGFMDKNFRLKDIQEILECKPINDDIPLLISNNVKELKIEEIEYKGQKGKVLLKCKQSEWDIKQVQNLLKTKPYKFQPLGYELSHSVIKVDDILIDSKSLYEYLDFQPTKLLEKINELNKELELIKTEISKAESKKSSTYSTPALEVCQAVIQNFWEDWTPDSAKDVTQATIKNWILHNFPDFQANAPRHAIDQVCRKPITKIGGKNRKNCNLGEKQSIELKKMKK